MQQHKLNLKRLYSTANTNLSSARQQPVGPHSSRKIPVSTADATYLVAGEGSRELTQQATNLHVRQPFCEDTY